MKPSDVDLVRYSAAGDRGAFREVFDRKHRLVYRIAYQILSDRGAAEDIVQETFLTLWQRADQHDPSQPLDPWLRRIVTNKAIDRWRARRRDPKSTDDTGGAGPAAHTRLPGGEGLTQDPTIAARLDSLQRVWNEVASLLPPQQRAAFYLREIEGADTSEVAETLGCSASAVRSHIALARKRLREEILERYPELARGRA